MWYLIQSEFHVSLNREGGIVVVSNLMLFKTSPEIIQMLEMYTGCPRRNGQNFGRVFLMLKYTDITQNTYIQS